MTPKLRFVCGTGCRLCRRVARRERWRRVGTHALVWAAFFFLIIVAFSSRRR